MVEWHGITYTCLRTIQFPIIYQSNFWFKLMIWPKEQIISLMKSLFLKLKHIGVLLQPLISMLMPAKTTCAQESKSRWSWPWCEVLPRLLQQHLLRFQRCHCHQDCQCCQGDVTSAFKTLPAKANLWFSRMPSIFSSTMSLWLDFWEKISIWPWSTAKLTRWDTIFSDQTPKSGL